MDTRQEIPTQEPQEILSGRGEPGGKSGGGGQAAAALPAPHLLLCSARAVELVPGMLTIPLPASPPSTTPADTAYRELGLHLGVASMRCGERCRLWAGPQYGYGQQGSFSFPTVPPNANLV